MIKVVVIKLPYVIVNLGLLMKILIKMI